MDRDQGYWWAPDGTALLVARVDNAAVERRYISDPSTPAAPPLAVRYPAAGTPNADVALEIVRVEATGLRSLALPAAGAYLSPGTGLHSSTW